MPRVSANGTEVFPNFPVFKIGKDNKRVNMLTLGQTAPELNRSLTYLLRAMANTRIVIKDGQPVVEVNKAENITVRNAAKIILVSGIGVASEGRLETDRFVQAMPEPSDYDASSFNYSTYTGKYVDTIEVTRKALQAYASLVAEGDKTLSKAEEEVNTLFRANKQVVESFKLVNPEPIYTTSDGKGKGKRQGGTKSYAIA